MAQQLSPFPCFHLRITDPSNAGSKWRKWINRFENFLVASNITNDVRKKALLLHYAGEDVFDIFESLKNAPTSLSPDAQATSGRTTTQTGSRYSSARAMFDEYFSTLINTAFGVYPFRQAQEQSEDSLDAFRTRLRKLARGCGFANVELEIPN